MCNCGKTTVRVKCENGHTFTYRHAKTIPTQQALILDRTTCKECGTAKMRV
jgi:hypothetical protein